MISNQWCTIESDPAVFTELISRLGVPSVQVQEIYSLEDTHQVESLKPIYGFIFLFKWVKETAPKEVLEVYDNDLFFARQIVNNACATQAIVSLLLNAPLEIGGALKEFSEFSKDLSPEDRGLALGNSDSIRSIHNDFKPPEAFVHHEKKKPKKASDAFHFITYVPHKGNVYELDGLKAGPVKLGTYTDYDSWIQVAKESIQERIHLYEGAEIRFTLLAVCESLGHKAESKLNSQRQHHFSLLLELQALGYEGDLLKNLAKLKQEYPEIKAPASSQSTQEALLQQVEKVQNEITMYGMQMSEEKDKAAAQKRQNARRKHNYVPLICEMLKIAAKKGKISEFLLNSQKKK